MSSRNHSYFQDLLETHISGAPLDPEDRLELFDHVESCDQCRLMLEAEERLTARMKTIPRMVAPSDLRSKILSQAMRDHTERTTTPSEDPHVADLLVTPPQPKQITPAADLVPAITSEKQELPFFPGLVPPRPGRLRTAWRKASPALATSFLVAASVGALYTGQFQGIPLAGQAQQLVWGVVDSALGREPAPDIPQTAIASTEDASQVIEHAAIPALPLQESGTVTAAATSSLARPVTAPLPGTAEVAGFIHGARGWLASVDSTVAALARASEERIPAPAEKSAPQIAALVLKPTDSRSDPGGFRQSELAAALEAVAHSQPGGRLASQDQFAMDGHRYRLYTLELPAGSASRLVKNLTPYQATADGVVVKALTSQDHFPASAQGDIHFFAGHQSGLRDAIETVSPVVSTGRHERIRVIVVE